MTTRRSKNRRPSAAQKRKESALASERTKHRLRHHLYRPFRRSTQPGAVPGTVRPSVDAAPPQVDLVTYTTEDFQSQQSVALDDIKRARKARQKKIWIDISGLGDAALLRSIADLFDLHSLAMEDAVNLHQRPKVEAYESHLYIVCRMADRVDGHLETEQMSIFLGDDFVITIQERAGDCLGSVRKRLTRASSMMRQEGPDYLAYAIIDAIIDDYYPVLEQFGDALEELERELAANDGTATIHRLHQVRADLLALRRSVWPQREALLNLMRDESGFTTERTRLYLRDCYDHTVNLLDVTETYRELCADLRELHYAELSQRTNEVMRVLTMISTIFIPLSFIAGVYGMNFDTSASRLNMPELHSPYGYPAVVGAMSAIALAMLIQFWRRGWLGPRSR